MRENFDTIYKMYNKAVNAQEEITWTDYDPYGLAMLRLKGKLEYAYIPFPIDRCMLFCL
jgi:hypothetical protein